MYQRRNYWPVIVLLSSLLAEAAFFWEWGNPLRWILVFWFLLFCPGMAFAYLLPGKDQITRLFLVIVMSVALDAAVTQVVLYLGKWSPHLILLILVGLCWLGILLKFIINISRRVPTNTSTNNFQGVDIARIRSYLGIIQRGWWLILISTLVTVNLSLVYSYYFATPMYEAVAQFIVSPNLQNTAITTTSTVNSQDTPPDEHTVISTYADIINSYQIRSGALELMLENPDDFTEYTTSVTLPPNENVIRFSVKGPNPETAALLANSIGQHAIDSIKTFYFAFNIDFLDRALIPINSYQPRPAQDASLALLIGLVFGVALAILRDQIAATLGRKK